MDFVSTLQDCLTARGWTIPRLAKAMSYSYGYVWEVARGKKPPSPAFAERADAALTTGGVLLSVVTGHREVEDMHRRTVLRGLGALSATGPLATLEAVRHGLMSTLTDTDPTTADLDEWDEIVQEYGHTYLMAPSERVLESLTADVGVVQEMILATTGSEHRGYCRVAGSLAAITAMVLANTGDTRSSLRWWRTARTAADRSGDLLTRMGVRDWEVVRGSYERRHPRVILNRADEALAVADGYVCRGTVGVWSGVAQTWAGLGAAEQARQALVRVAELSERLPADVVADEDSIFGWPEFRLRHTESYVYTELGDTARAYAAQDRALELYPATMVRERAQMLMHRAACMIRDGDVTGGLRYAHDVITGLPDEHRSHRLVVEMAHRALAAAPVEARGGAEYPALRDLVALPAAP